MARIFQGPQGGRKGRALGKWDEKRQLPPRLRNVVNSYKRDGFTEDEALQKAQEWQERMKPRSEKEQS